MDLNRIINRIAKSVRALFPTRPSRRHDDNIHPNQSETQFSAIKAVLEKTLTVDDESCKELAQCISDYAVGCNILPVLSERLTPEYLFYNMGSLDGPEECDLERLQHVEAYSILFESDSAEFVVDRASIFNVNDTKKTYNPKQDSQLINLAIQKWFKENVFMKGRVKGSDTAMIDNLIELNIKVKPRQIVDRDQNGDWKLKDLYLLVLLKYGILHFCFEFPKSLHSGEKVMYIEMYASLLNVETPADYHIYPLWHRLWEYKELRFKMEAITYSDQQCLRVRVPGYG